MMPMRFIPPSFVSHTQGRLGHACRRTDPPASMMLGLCFSSQFAFFFRRAFSISTHDRSRARLAFQCRPAKNSWAIASPQRDTQRLGTRRPINECVEGTCKSNRHLSGTSSQRQRGHNYAPQLLSFGFILLIDCKRTEPAHIVPCLLLDAPLHSQHLAAVPGRVAQ